MRNKPGVVAYLHKGFDQKPKSAAGTYKIVWQLVNAAGDIEDAVFRFIVDKIGGDGMRKRNVTESLVRPSILRDLRRR